MLDQLYSILPIIFSIIFFIAIITLSVLFIILLIQKIKSMKQIDGLEILEKEKSLYAELNDQLICINTFKQQIDDQIVTEVNYAMKKEIYLKNANYDALNFDKDSEEIAKIVFNYIQPSLIMNLSTYNSIYKESYWMNYIYKRTQIAILNLIRAGS